MTSLTATLVLVGAGCASSGQIAIPAGGANGETALRFSDDAAPLRQQAAPAPSSGAYPRPTAFPGVLPSAEISGKVARVVTPKGEIVFDILDGEAPKAASNFVALAKSGFYDGLAFHRVEPGFVIQGGDPRGDGTGGPGYRFEDEPVRLDYDAGIVAMANAGPNTNGSQFFIMLEDVPLAKDYVIFGKVVAGMDVVRAIRVGDVMTTVTIEEK